MNILHAIPYFSPQKGGDVNVCYNICNELARRGHNVTILTSNQYLDEEFAGKLSDCKIIVCPTVFKKHNILFTPEMAKWLKKNINNFDIVHSHTFRSYQNILISKYAQQKNIPFIIQAHGSLPSSNLTHDVFDIIWGNQLLKRADRFVAISDREFCTYLEFGLSADKVIRVDNGIRVADYDNLPSKYNFKEKYRIARETKIILYLGRLHESKGIMTLLSAYKQLIKDGTINTILILAGPDDGYRNEILEFIKSNNIETILLTGFISEMEKLEALVDAEILVIPDYSGFPIIFLEASCCGVPIVTTSKGDPIDFLKETSVVVKGEKELTDKIKSLIIEKDTLINISSNQKKIVSSKFDWSIIIKKYEDFYMDIANRKNQ